MAHTKVAVATGTGTGDVLKIMGQGMPKLNSRRSNIRGDLTVEFKVRMPKSLSSNQRTLLEMLAGRNGRQERQAHHESAEIPRRGQVIKVATGRHSAGCDVRPARTTQERRVSQEHVAPGDGSTRSSFPGKSTDGRVEKPITARGTVEEAGFPPEFCTSTDG